jgi:hypothetical protein
VDNGKLSESKLPTLDSLVADLLDHDKELKRTEKVNLRQLAAIEQRQTLLSLQTWRPYREGLLAKASWEATKVRPQKQGQQESRWQQKFLDTSTYSRGSSNRRRNWPSNPSYID